MKLVLVSKTNVPRRYKRMTNSDDNKKLGRRVPEQDRMRVPTEEEVRRYFYGHNEPGGYALPKQRDWVDEEVEDD